MFHLNTSKHKPRFSLQVSQRLCWRCKTLFSGKLDRDQSRGSKVPPDAALWFHMLFYLHLCVAQQSLSKLPSDKSRSKRSKEPKPRVKKLKYHQYIPPDRKQELSEVQMDSAYARLLQQQQQFLQLQILSQQQFNFQPSPAAKVKYGCSATQTQLFLQVPR